MDATTRPIPTALRAYVQQCFGYHLRDVPLSTHIGMPTPAVVVVIDLDDGILLSGLGHARPERLDISLSGVCSAPATIHQSGTVRGVMLYLTPLGCRALLGMPASEVVNQAVTLEQAIGSAARELREQMQEAGEWSCLDVVLAWLHTRLTAQPAESAALDAWGCIVAGARRVETLARETGWSRRHLHHQLRNEIGLAPRTLLSLNRFAGSVADVSAGLALSEVAARHGYADQAHLARDWRRFAGCSPSGWLAHEAAGTGSSGRAQATRRA